MRQSLGKASFSRSRGRRRDKLKTSDPLLAQRSRRRILLRSSRILGMHMSSTGLAYIVSIVYLLVAAFWTDHEHPLEFLDPHGLFMVFVGTAVISVIAVPWEYIKRFFFMIRAVSRR